jgi:hypothetical protein
MRPLIEVAALVLILLTNMRPGLAQDTSVEELLPQLTRLELAVGIAYDSEQIAGTATLTLKNTSTTSLAHVPLLLNRLMRIEAVRGDGGQTLMHRQRIALFDDVGRYQVNAAQVDLPMPLLPGASVRFAVDFTGYLVGYTEVGMSEIRWTASSRSCAKTHLRSRRRSSIVAHQPGRSARAVRFEVSATVPEDLVAATGGEEIGRAARDGLVTWRYRSREPAPYLIIAIAPYRVAEAGGLRVFHFPNDSVGAQRVLEASQRATAQLQTDFRPTRTSAGVERNGDTRRLGFASEPCRRHHPGSWRLPRSDSDATALPRADASLERPGP